MGEADQFSDEFGGVFPFILPKLRGPFILTGQVSSARFMYYYPGYVLRGVRDSLGALCTGLEGEAR